MMSFRIMSGQSDYRLTLSPLTKYIVDISIDSINSGKNVAFEYPSQEFISSILVAFKYSFEKRKTTLIFTSSSNVINYNNAYYSLQWGSLPCFRACPIGVKKQDKVVLKPVLNSGTKKSIRTQLKEAMAQDLALSHKPRIIITSDGDIDSIKGDSIQIKELENVGLAIFDNPPSKRGYYHLVNWCISKNIPFIILSSYLSEADLEYFSLLSDVLVFPFRSNIIFNDFIEKISRDYFIKSGLTDSISFDLDHIYDYERKIDFDIKIVDIGLNVAGLAEDMWRLYKKSEFPYKLNRELSSLMRLVFSSISSFCNIDSNLRYSSYSQITTNGMGFCKNIDSLSKCVNKEQRVLCDSILSNYYLIRSSIERCRNPLYDNGYSRDSKFSTLFDFIDSNNSEKIITVITSNSSEVTRVKEFVGMKYGDVSKIIVDIPKTISNAYPVGSVAIVSGKLEKDQMHVLNYPFESITILAYPGEDQLIRDSISEYYSGSPKSNCIFKKSISELLDISTNASNYEKYSTFSDIFSMNDVELNLESSEFSNDENEVNDDFNYIHSKYGGSTSVKINLHEYDEAMQESKKVTVDIVDDSANTTSIRLMNISDGYEVVHKFDSSSLVAILDPKEKMITEKPISSEIIGSHIIVRFNSSKRSSSLTDILIELFDLDSIANISAIDIWDSVMNDFRLNYDIKSIYEKYILLNGNKQLNTVQTWINRRTMGPEESDDIRIMGIISNNKEIENNADYIEEQMNLVRGQKRLIGRQLFKIVSDIIHNTNTDYDPRIVELKSEIEGRIYLVKGIEQAD